MTRREAIFPRWQTRVCLVAAHIALVLGSLLAVETVVRLVIPAPAPLEPRWFVHEGRAWPWCQPREFSVQNVDARGVEWLEYIPHLRFTHQYATNPRGYFNANRQVEYALNPQGYRGWDLTLCATDESSFPSRHI